MPEKQLGVAIVGCGNIAERYAQDIVTYPELRLLGVTDLLVERAESLAGQFACRSYASLADLLADPAVDIVVNLTIHHAHYAVTRQILEAGKHVHSEKPLAMTHAQAQALVELAHERGVRLSASPFALLNEAQQTAWKYIRDGRLGTVRLAYAEMNWGRIETWHPAPGPFYEVGALWDVGVYPLSVLTGIFGPARAVTGSGRVLLADRVSANGTPFHVETPDVIVAVLALTNGTLVRLTTDFYVSNKSKQAGIEFHGDAGSLYLQNPYVPAAALEFAPFNEPYASAPLVREPPPAMRWGRAVQDLAESLRERRPHRSSGEHAAHVVEILEATTRSLHEGRAVAIHSAFPPPEPAQWAL